MLLAAAVGLGASGATAAGGVNRAAGSIHIRGTAYSFDNQVPIAGARIRVAELPGAKATSGPDGTYDLTVPDGVRVTPFIEAPGYHGIYLQTFVTSGRDLRRVNFQVPTVTTYHLLATLLGVHLDANDNPTRCVVVSTFSTRNVRDLSFADFIAYGAHGVAGATANASPALPDPIYFNHFVIPDRTLTESSVDGGVLWLNVPRGVYRFTAHHPTARFASFVASCRPGRLINANPPQGLYQLKPGERADTGVAASLASARFVGTARHARVLRLRIRASEYVLPDARLLRGNRQLGAVRPDRFAPGGRTLSIPLVRGVTAGPVSLRLSLEDGAGNQKVVHRRLRVPAPAAQASRVGAG